MYLTRIINYHVAKIQFFCDMDYVKLENKCLAVN